MLDKNVIRRAMRARRQQQSKREQTQASQRLLKLAKRLLRPYQTVALFVPFDGEPDILRLQTQLLNTKRCVALPKINRRRDKSMTFVQRSATGVMVKNQYGIAQPSQTKRLRLSQISAILLPLTAFDRQGNRLGMGAGFYDRALAGLQQRRLRKPLLIGVAFQWQEMATLPADPWDLPLHAILTDKEIIRI